MVFSMVDIENTKIETFSRIVEKLENEWEEFEENFKVRMVDLEEFESKKVNLLEEIKSLSYEIKQTKDLLNTRDEREQQVVRELDSLSEQFQTEVDDETGIATVFISPTLDTHFEIDFDCSRYPEPPYFFIPKTMDDFLGSNFINNLKALRKWSRKKPPHIVDIFKEMEEKLVEFFQKEEVIDDREKLANRRKFIELARTAEKAGNIVEAINLYQCVLEISQDLKDKASYFKYKKLVEELKTNAEGQ